MQPEPTRTELQPSAPGHSYRQALVLGLGGLGLGALCLAGRRAFTRATAWRAVRPSSLSTALRHPFLARAAQLRTAPPTQPLAALAGGITTQYALRAAASRAGTLQGPSAAAAALSSVSKAQTASQSSSPASSSQSQYNSSSSRSSTWWRQAATLPFAALGAATTAAVATAGTALADAPAAPAAPAAAGAAGAPAGALQAARQAVGSAWQEVVLDLQRINAGLRPGMSELKGREPQVCVVHVRVHVHVSDPHTCLLSHRCSCQSRGIASPRVSVRPHTLTGVQSSGHRWHRQLLSHVCVHSCAFRGVRVPVCVCVQVSSRQGTGNRETVEVTIPMREGSDLKALTAILRRAFTPDTGGSVSSKVRVLCVSVLCSFADVCLCVLTGQCQQRGTSPVCVYVCVCVRHTHSAYLPAAETCGWS